MASLAIWSAWVPSIAPPPYDEAPIWSLLVMATLMVSAVVPEKKSRPLTPSVP